MDHGKSTLSDRLIEATGGIEKRKMKAQVLDSLEVERERGITVKSAAISLKYVNKIGISYTLNLIDTPGHVDFSYEVSRSLAACEGAILVVDASQSLQAQTFANFYLAFSNNLEIIPVISKIDLPFANVERVFQELEQSLGFNRSEVLCVSAKTGQGIPELLESLVDRIPPPKIESQEKIKALIFDSFYDAFRGVILCIKIVAGSIKKHDKIKLFFAKTVYQVEEVGILSLERCEVKILEAGYVGYVILGIKTAKNIHVGDTILEAEDTETVPLLGYKEVKPIVFAGVYPVDKNEFENLKQAMEKLCLNDSSIFYEKHSSVALGTGYRCGFLGLLHMEIFQERLSKEFQVEIILTAPSVRYWVVLKNGKELYIDNPTQFPNSSEIEKILEPYTKVSIIGPKIYLGNIIQLVSEKRGIQKNISYLAEDRVESLFEIPLAEIVYDFYDRLKSVTKGYASLDYEVIPERETKVAKVDILINKEPVDALSFLVFEEDARSRSLYVLSRLKEEIPRHMFAVTLQASIGAKIIAREDISAMRKDVTAKCYGGDISRKRKLLEKQKEGKKRMRSVGNVDIPQKAFLSILTKRDV